METSGAEIESDVGVTLRVDCPFVKLTTKCPHLLDLTRIAAVGDLREPSLVNLTSVGPIPRNFVPHTQR